MGCPACPPAGPPSRPRTAAVWSRNSGFAFYYYSAGGATIVFSSWKHLQKFWLTASQKVAAEGGGSSRLSHPPAASYLHLFWLANGISRGYCVIEPNLIRPAPSQGGNPNSILSSCPAYIYLQGYSSKIAHLVCKPMFKVLVLEYG